MRGKELLTGSDSNTDRYPVYHSVSYRHDDVFTTYFNMSFTGSALVSHEDMKCSWSGRTGVQMGLLLGLLSVTDHMSLCVMPVETFTCVCLEKGKYESTFLLRRCFISVPLP